MIGYQEIEKAKDRPHDKNKKARNGDLWFCVAKAPGWALPIWHTLKKHLKALNLTWILPRMSYHLHQNLRELFNADLQRKMMAGIACQDHKNLSCNFKGHEKNRCNFAEMCRDRCIVCALEDKQTDKLGTGFTQQALKQRTTGHLTDVRDLLRDSRKSETFAAYCAREIQNFKQDGRRYPTN